MKLKINGKIKEIEGDELNVHQLLTALELDPDQSGIAVAINFSVLPRSEWEETQLKNGDEIEVISATAGG